MFVHDHRTCNGQSLSGTLPNFLGGEERVTDCNSFMIRVRACTIRCRCHNHCRRSRFSQLGTQTWGNRFSSSKRRISCVSADPSSVCALASSGSQSRLRSTARTPTRRAAVQTNERAHSLPSRGAPSHPGFRVRGRNSPLPRGAPVVVPVALLCPYSAAGADIVMESKSAGCQTNQEHSGERSRTMDI